MKKRVLIACEFSGAVRNAFAAKGWDAWSCDLLPSETPGNHYQGDIRDMLPSIGTNPSWELLIAHPPCTYLANSGARWLYQAGEKDAARWEQMTEAAWFFWRLLNEKASPKIAVENPIMHKHGARIVGTKQTQVIQPWMFGHGETKATCLWLKNLPPPQADKHSRRPRGARTQDAARPGSVEGTQSNASRHCRCDGGTVGRFVIRPVENLTAGNHKGDEMSIGDIRNFNQIHQQSYGVFTAVPAKPAEPDKCPCGGIITCKPIGTEYQSDCSKCSWHGAGKTEAEAIGYLRAGASAKPNPVPNSRRLGDEELIQVGDIMAGSNGYKYPPNTAADYHTGKRAAEWMSHKAGRAVYRPNPPAQPLPVTPASEDGVAEKLKNAIGFCGTDGVEAINAAISRITSDSAKIKKQGEAIAELNKGLANDELTISTLTRERDEARNSLMLVCAGVLSLESKAKNATADAWITNPTTKRACELRKAWDARTAAIESSPTPFFVAADAYETLAESLGWDRKLETSYVFLARYRDAAIAAETERERVVWRYKGRARTAEFNGLFLDVSRDEHGIAWTVSNDDGIVDIVRPSDSPATFKQAMSQAESAAREYLKGKP